MVHRQLCVENSRSAGLSVGCLLRFGAEKGRGGNCRCNYTVGIVVAIVYGRNVEYVVFHVDPTRGVVSLGQILGPGEVGRDTAGVYFKQGVWPTQGS